MSAERSKQVEQIYHAARECAPGERAGFIEMVKAVVLNWLEELKQHVPIR